ncbi:MAG TPA: DUF4080 domain-containing protein [Clostridiales bacterium]|nr:DUF4080 domain-containing protein [Clostridiales bacterium]
MKIGLIGVNSQFVHSNLALYYLRENLPQGMTGEIREFNNNEPILSIFYELAAGNYDVMAFSVYLWNRETVLKLLSLVKEALPETVLILGGPEPTYATEAFSPYGFVVPGALEPLWPHLLTAIAGGEDPQGSMGLLSGSFFAEDWKFPYREEDLSALKHRLVYYETSRGCPYRCAFCLSSAEEQRAYLPLERVKKELDFFLHHEFSVVKLVDRTFNAPKERAKEILRYLLDHYRAGITFHFELKGELLDRETVDLLTAAPRNYFQVEIGIQSLNEKTLAESCRFAQWQQTKAYYQELIAADSLHTHFDLIAALPHEDLTSFAQGFNEVMSLYPDYLQLGFLKLLPGTKLAEERERFGYIAETFPPYEVVRSKDISTAELHRLKKIDHFMDTVYNKGNLRQTLRFALKNNGNDSFTLFSALAESADYETTLQTLLPQEGAVWHSLLRFDDFLQNHGATVTAAEERELKGFLQDKKAVEAVLPHYRDMAPREIYKRVRLLRFPVAFSFDGKGYLEEATAGESGLLLDYHLKGKQKKGKCRPDVYVLNELA